MYYKYRKYSKREVFVLYEIRNLYRVITLLLSIHIVMMIILYIFLIHDILSVYSFYLFEFCSHIHCRDIIVAVSSSVCTYAENIVAGSRRDVTKAFLSILAIQRRGCQTKHFWARCSIGVTMYISTMPCSLLITVTTICKWPTALPTRYPAC